MARRARETCYRRSRDTSRSCLAGCDTLGSMNFGIASTDPPPLAALEMPFTLSARRSRAPNASRRSPSFGIRVGSLGRLRAGRSLRSVARRRAGVGRLVKHPDRHSCGQRLAHRRRSTRDGKSVILSLSARVSSDAVLREMSHESPASSSATVVVLVGHRLIRRGWRSRLRSRALRRRLTWR